MLLKNLFGTSHNMNVCKKVWIKIEITKFKGIKV
jgi:hypothetical protein